MRGGLHVWGLSWQISPVGRAQRVLTSGPEVGSSVKEARRKTNGTYGDAIVRLRIAGVIEAEILTCRLSSEKARMTRVLGFLGRYRAFGCLRGTC